MFLKHIVLFFPLIHFFLADGLKCKLTRNLYDGGFLTCEGDYCVKTVQMSGDLHTEIFGCVSGFPNAEPGCFLDEASTMCFCNNSNFCNDNSDISKSSKILGHTVECYFGAVVDGKIVGNETCVEKFCSLTETWRGDKENLTVHMGCDQFLFPPAFCFFKGNGCFKSPHDEGDDRLQMKWTCICETDFCNAPTSFTVSNKVGLVKCIHETEFTNSTKNTTKSRTCFGDYCSTIVTETSGESTVKKLCINLSNGAKLSAEKYEINMFQTQKTMYFCQKDLCNNNNEEIGNSTEIEEKSIECYSGLGENGMVSSDQTCRGDFCYLIETLYKNEEKSDIRVRCNSVVDKPEFRFFKGKGCINWQDTHSNNNERMEWVCECDTALCNTPNAFNLSHKLGYIKCVIGKYALNSTENGTNLETCYGDYCFTIVKPKHLFSQVRKGCAILLNGASLKQKYESYKDLVTTYFCEKNLCNKGMPEEIFK